MTLEERTLMWCVIFSGGEGETCLRSSDCLEGLCCARHFWSRICKPVLTEGQVCTRHRRKGAHGLEIFQRCDCGSGLSCRGQREKPGAESRNLHTCQPRWPRRTALGWLHTHTQHAHACRHTCSGGKGKLIARKDAPLKGLIVFPGRMQRKCTVQMFLLYTLLFKTFSPGSSQKADCFCFPL